MRIHLILMLCYLETTICGYEYIYGKICDIQSEDVSRQCFVKEVLLTLSHSPNQLAVDKNTNTLYFSFDSGQGEYVPGVFKIDTKKLTVLKGIKDAFSIASHPTIEEIYFGGSHGIYKYNTVLKNLKRLDVTNLDIWWLVIKKKLYFIKFPSLNAYYYENRTVRPIPQLRNNSVNQFLFDEVDNIFFINGSGLYGLNNNSYNAKLLRDHPRFLGMAIDNQGLVHLCSEDGIYVISKIVQKVKRILSVQGVLGLTFDKDNNLIYSDSHEIIRLVPASREKPNKIEY
ncbi:ommochrome-binding protein-like [Epargyreus clarus]|uniref:ommochrome-binding protein-like n=1 Tax=Epargyreus clarus TaxID=520877 RepID=UPI003C2BBF9B